MPLTNEDLLYEIVGRLFNEFPDLPDPIHWVPKSIRWKIWCDSTVSFSVNGKLVTWYLELMGKTHHGHTTDINDLCDVIYTALNTSITNPSLCYKLPENRFT